MKKLFLLFGLVTILFSSCQKTTPPQLAAIPNNATFVVAIEGKELMKKGGLDKLEDYKFYTKIKSEFGENKLFEKIAKDPKSTGLGIDQIYVFGILDGEKPYGSVSFKMKDAKTFEETIKEMMQLSKCSEKPQIEDKTSYKIMKDKNASIVWNKDLCFMFVGADVENLKYEEFFAMPAEKSITSMADFKEFQKQKYDIGFWMSYGALMKFSSSFAGTKMPMQDDYAGLFVHAYLEFKNDEIKASYVMTPKAEVDKFHKKYPILKKDFDNTLMQAFPENSYFAFKGGMNILECSNMLKNIMKETQQNEIQPQDSLTTDCGNTHRMNRMNNFYAEILESPTVNTVVNSLGGDFLFSIYDFAKGPFPIPLAGLAFTLKSEDDFSKLLALLPEGTLQKKDDYYMMSTGVMVSIYVVQKGKNVFITDDADAITTFKKGNSKSLENGKLGKEMKNSLGAFYLNLDIETYPENIQSLLKDAGDQFGSGIGNAIDFLSIFKDLTVVTKDEYSCEFSLKMKKSNENSLKQFLKKVDPIIESIPMRRHSCSSDEIEIEESQTITDTATMVSE